VKRIAQDLSINYKNTPALIDIDSYNSTGVSFSLSEKFYTNRNGVYAPNINVLENQGYSPVKSFYYNSYAYISQILSLDAYDAFYLSFEDKYKKYGEDYYVDFEFDKNENPGLSISNLGIDGQSQELGQFYIENYSEKKAEVKVFIFPCKKGEYNIEFKTKSDPVIVGKNNYYSIDYNNESAEEDSKAFKETKLKHAGGLVKLTIDESVPIGRNGGVMGFIFDLKNGEKGKDFFIVAVRKNGYYVSKYSNVTNFSAYNFGFSGKEDNTQEDGTTEIEYVTAYHDLPLSIDENGNSYVYVYAFCNIDGSYDWKILNGNATNKVKSLSDKEFCILEFTEDMILAEGTIPATETGYVKQVQNKLAVYANIYSNGYLNGTWDFVGTYR
ncbi:MAG: hypothetical protein K6E78_10240, partial [Treponema sp.]|nr:hypothetical protein [Treponema sp.]